jgi:hypothetical protein
MESEVLSLPVSIEAWIDRFGDEFGYMPCVPVLESLELEPGSPERVGEMRRRVRRGQPVFSRLDRTKNGKESSYATDPISTKWEGSKEYGSEHSPCGTCRYRIWRRWESDLPTCLFIGLRAEYELDPKAEEKFQALATSHGCGAYQRVNLFGLRCKKPEELWLAENSIGDWNDYVIRIAMLSCDFVICGWGRAGEFQGRSSTLVAALEASFRPHSLFCYGITEPYKASSGSDSKVRFPIPFSKVAPSTAMVPLPTEFLESATND